MGTIRQHRNTRFSALVAAARCAPQMVTRRGLPAVVVIDAAEYERLQSLQRAHASSFADALLAMPRDDGAFESSRLRPRDPTL